MADNREHVEVFVDDQGRKVRSNDDRHRHKKKKRHRSRSSSNSRSRSREARRVHINQALANALTGNSSFLMERCQQQEAQMITMGHELTSSLARINVLELQLRNAVSSRSEYEQRCTILEQQNVKLQGALKEIQSVIATLEGGIESMRKEKTSSEAERARLVAELEKSEAEKKAALASEASAKDKSEFFSKRNETLLKKCEELVEKVKCGQQAKEEALRQVEVIKRQNEETNTSSEKERKHLAMELRNVSEREAQLRKDKNEVERKYVFAEKQLRNLREQHADEVKQLEEKYNKLHANTRRTVPAYDTECGIATMSRVLESVKRDLFGELDEMKRRLEPELLPSRILDPTK